MCVGGRAVSLVRGQCLTPGVPLTFPVCSVIMVSAVIHVALVVVVYTRLNHSIHVG